MKGSDKMDNSKFPKGLSAPNQTDNKEKEPEIIGKKQFEEDPWINKYVDEMMRPVIEVLKKRQLSEKAENSENAENTDK